MESQYSQQEKKTLIWASVRVHIYAFTNVFTQKTLIKIWKTKKKEKEIAVITLGKEISHITEKTTKTNKNIKEKGQIASKIVLKLNIKNEPRSPTITSKPERMQEVRHLFSTN